MRRVPRRWLWAALLSLLLPVTARGGDGAVDAKGTEFDPERLRATLVSDKSEWTLGEPCFVHLVVENGNSVPVEFPVHSLGLIAKGEDGFPACEVWAPGSVSHYFSGPSWKTTVEAGATWFWSVPLHRRVRLLRPGKWTVSVSYDLSIHPSRALPVRRVETVLAFREPSPEEACDLVKAGLPAPLRVEPHDGSRCEGFPYTESLAHAALVPALLESARAGSEDAVGALGIVETTAATRGLVSLLTPGDSPVAHAAAMELVGRTPSLEKPTDLPYWEWQPHLQLPRYRKALLLEAWNPALAGPVREWARGALSSAEPETTNVATSLLDHLGTAEDAPALLSFLERQLAMEGAPPPVDGDTGETPKWLRGVEALDTLIGRGLAPAAEPKTPSEMVQFLRTIRLREAFRPDGWEAKFEAAMRGSSEFVRRAALRSIPHPVPDSLLPGIETVLREAASFESVEGAAQLAASGRLQSLLPAVLDALRRDTDPFRMRGYARAAVELGDRVDCLLVLARRLDEEETGHAVLGCLLGLVEPEGSCGWTLSERPAEEMALLKARWVRFLNEYPSVLRAGIPFSTTAGLVPPDLFPEGFEYQLKGAGTWP